MNIQTAPKAHICHPAAWAAILGAILISACSTLQIDTSSKIETPALPEDLNTYIAQEESVYSDITPGAESVILWAETPGVKTEFSIVYLHGFSATRQETAPLSETIALELGANLYYPRLTGHGRPGEFLAQATVNDWLNDAIEALAIGKELGEKVIVIGVSTGSSLAIWLAGSEYGRDAHAYITISPNLGPYDKNSELLFLPWAQNWGPWIMGPTRSWKPSSELNARYWTHEYPVQALFPMMGLVKLARSVDPANLNQPFMVIYSPNDEVVNPQNAEVFFSELGSPLKQDYVMTNTGELNSHVLAGDILSPETTDDLANRIIDFIIKIQKL